MRLSPVWITGFVAAALCLHGQAQSPESQPPPSADTKDAQATEAKGMPPRSAPGDYPSQVKAGEITIAAEFLGHSVPRQEGPLSSEDYVVVETAFFGSPQARLRVSIDDFSLRINGKKAPLPSQPYGLVAKSIKDPEWVPPDQPDKKKASSFNTNGQADPNEPPPPVHVPIELRRAMAQHLQKSSLPQGDRVLPEAGLLFFPYRGKAESIHSLELIYSGPAGKATLALQP